MTSKETTQDFMLQVADARINKEVNKNKALTLEVERLTEALDNSENNVKRVSLLMSELKLNGSI
jgi:uncharacterized protein (DUF1778 family)